MALRGSFDKAELLQRLNNELHEWTKWPSSKKKSYAKCLMTQDLCHLKKPLDMPCEVGVAGSHRPGVLILVCVPSSGLRSPAENSNYVRARDGMRQCKSAREGYEALLFRDRGQALS